jgi:hypothetical protein
VLSGLFVKTEDTIASIVSSFEASKRIRINLRGSSFPETVLAVAEESCRKIERNNIKNLKLNILNFVSLLLINIYKKYVAKPYRAFNAKNVPDGGELNA